MNRSIYYSSLHRCNYKTILLFQPPLTKEERPLAGTGPLCLDVPSHSDLNYARSSHAPDSSTSNHLEIIVRCVHVACDAFLSAPLVGALLFLPRDVFDASRVLPFGINRISPSATRRASAFGEFSWKRRGETRRKRPDGIPVELKYARFGLTGFQGSNGSIRSARGRFFKVKEPMGFRGKELCT